MAQIKVDADKYNKLKHSLLRVKRLIGFLVEELVDSVEVDNGSSVDAKRKR